MRIWIKRLGISVLLVLVLLGFYFGLKEKPVLVDVGVLDKQDMSVTINEEGIARVKNLYTLSSPIAGHLSRTSLDEGDPVEKLKTIVASIHPLDPPFIDDRTRRELEAAVQAAESAVALAMVERESVNTALTLAKSEYRRAVTLKNTNVISDSDLERTYSELKLHEAQLEGSEATILLREAQLGSAEARLTPAQIGTEGLTNSECCVDIVSPADGVVLTMYTRSEQALAAGGIIADIGDPTDLEILVDLLSSDAVRIDVGASAQISDWGGDQVLQATVKRIDPAAYTKVSALGIEEQRVNVVLSLSEPAPRLGHGFRVFTRLTVWARPSVLQIPLGALFRSDGEWAVFVVEEGLAKSTQIKLGQMNDRSAQILEGLSVDDVYILYPNDLITTGTEVEIRNNITP